VGGGVRTEITVQYCDIFHERERVLSYARSSGTHRSHSTMFHNNRQFLLLYLQWVHVQPPLSYILSVLSPVITVLPFIKL
jgi:hypothetical protein